MTFKIADVHSAPTSFNRLPSICQNRNRTFKNFYQRFLHWKGCRWQAPRTGCCQNVTCWRGRRAVFSPQKVQNKRHSSVSLQLPLNPLPRIKLAARAHRHSLIMYVTRHASLSGSKSAPPVDLQVIEFIIWRLDVTSENILGAFVQEQVPPFLFYFFLKRVCIKNNVAWFLCSAKNSTVQKG